MASKQSSETLDKDHSDAIICFLWITDISGMALKQSRETLDKNYNDAVIFFHWITDISGMANTICNYFYILWQ